MDANTQEKLYQWGVFSLMLLTAFFFNVYTRLVSAISIVNNPQAEYLATATSSMIMLLIFTLLVAAFLGLVKLTENSKLFGTVLSATIVACLLSIVGAFLADMVWLFNRLLADGQSGAVLADTLDQYFSQEWVFYTVLILLLGLAIIIKKLESKSKDHKRTVSSSMVLASSLVIPLLVAISLPLANASLFAFSSGQQFNELPLSTYLTINSFYLITVISLMFYGIRFKAKRELPISWLIKFINGIGMSSAFVFCADVMLLLWPYHLMASRIGLSASESLTMAGAALKEQWIKFIPILFVMLAAGIYRQYVKRKQFNHHANVKDTTGSFGTADIASTDYLRKVLNAYDPANGPIAGQDMQNKLLYFPLVNKLTLSPPGGGKTTASSMLALLTENRPMCLLDSKGELWAVTARFRATVLKRKIVAIDPYGVLKGEDFSKNKPQELLFEYHLNPFDYIPEDEKQRDRMINAFAASFIINEESGNALHFDENAKILIRGYIDFMMKSLPPEARSLATLYQLLSEHQKDAQHTFDSMSGLSGRAAAAANQISRVGEEERGSILSTSYRQIDWMSDQNIQHTFSESNFDLRDFLKGDMDIYIIIPEDQVHEQSRLVRMILALLKAIITQAKPSELPKKKMLFLLEELAQFGYCPDVEQFIEVMRGRGVVVWTVFQSLKQIQMFKKPDLFLGAALKQIFTLDDVETMKWVQTLAATRTIQTKTLSTNSGDSRQKTQVFGGTVSQGEGQSVQETGTDLIHLNQIRELPKDEQFLFMHGAKMVHCKKVRYFEHPFFEGKYDPNPIEQMRD